MHDHALATAGERGEWLYGGVMLNDRSGPSPDPSPPPAASPGLYSGGLTRVGSAASVVSGLGGVCAVAAALLREPAAPPPARLRPALLDCG